MKLLQDITLEYYMEDMQYVINLSDNRRDSDTCMVHLQSYLSKRYSEEFVGAIFQLLLSCQGWVSRNWLEMKKVGLVNDDGVVNAILFALYDRIGALDHSDWSNVAEIPLKDLISEAQRYINSQK